MPVVIRASVVDLRSDSPKADDSFIVDTNVWLWLYYPPLTQNSAGEPLQSAIDYPNYFKSALAAKATLYSSALIFSELTHNIERKEKRIYESNLANELDAKVYRHDYPRQRLKVTQLVQDAWSDISSSSKLLDMNLDSNFMTESLSLFPATQLDGYDLFTAQLAKQSQVNQIITDDGDYATVAGLTIFTANQKILNLANQCGKLVVR